MLFLILDTLSPVIIFRRGPTSGFEDLGIWRLEDSKLGDSRFWDLLKSKFQSLVKIFYRQISRFDSVYLKNPTVCENRESIAFKTGKSCVQIKSPKL